MDSADRTFCILLRLVLGTKYEYIRDKKFGAGREGKNLLKQMNLCSESFTRWLFHEKEQDVGGGQKESDLWKEKLGGDVNQAKTC